MPNRPTTGWLMRLVFVAAILLWLCRQPSLDLPQWLLLPAWLFGIYWIVFLSKLKQIHWTTADPNYEPFDLQSEQTPRPVTESVAAISPQLEALGFTNRGHFRLSKLSAQWRGSPHTLRESAITPVREALVGVLDGGSRARVKETSLAFFTDFDDGLTLVTGNNKTRPLTPRIRTHQGSLAFTWIGDPVGSTRFITRASLTLEMVPGGLIARSRIPSTSCASRISRKRQSLPKAVTTISIKTLAFIV